MRLQYPLEVVTTAVSGRVLEVLGKGDRWWTRSEIRESSGVKSLERVRLVLHELTMQGIVEEERDGRQYRYRLNRSHLAADQVIGLANLRATFIQRLRLLLGSWAVPPTYAALFGSVARNAMAVESDVDIFVVHGDDIDEQTWDGQLRGAEEEVQGWLGNRVNFLTMSHSELGANGGRDAVGSILEEGITLVGSRAWLLRETANQ